MELSSQASKGISCPVFELITLNSTGLIVEPFVFFFYLYFTIIISVSSDNPFFSYNLSRQ